MTAFERKNSAPYNFNALESGSSIPVEIQFRHMNEARRVVEQIEGMMGRFEKYSLQGAKVSVVIDETHHRIGKSVFQVRVQLAVPGERLYVAQSAEKTGWHDGINVALYDTFDHVERQLTKRHGKRSRRRSAKAYEQVA